MFIIHIWNTFSHSWVNLRTINTLSENFLCCLSIFSLLLSVNVNGHLGVVTLTVILFYRETRWIKRLSFVVADVASLGIRLIQLETICCYPNHLLSTFIICCQPIISIIPNLQNVLNHFPHESQM